jgi:hypothetical protein
MQHVKKRSCSRATHGGFLRPAREKIRHAEIAEKIWKKKPSLKDALVYWTKDPRVDAYIGTLRSQSAQPSRLTSAPIGCRSKRVILNLCRRLGHPGSDRQVLKARRNHHHLATTDFIDRNLRPITLLSDRLNQESVNN